MKKHIFIVVIFLSVILLSCGSSNRNSADSPEYRQMLERLQDMEFTIENQWAIPARYSRVNLLGNPNHIQFEGDSVDLFLPFFGQRHSGGGYGTGGAIEYEGPLQNLRIEERPDRGQVNIFFRGKHESEILDFRVTLYPNGNANTSVTSSQRDQINYDGKIRRRQ